MNEIEKEIHSNFLKEMEATNLLLIREIILLRPWDIDSRNELKENQNKIIDIAMKTKLIDIDVSKLYSQLLIEYNIKDSKIEFMASLYNSIFGNLFNNQFEYLKFILDIHMKNNPSKEKYYFIKRFSNIYKRTRNHHIHFDEIRDEIIRNPYFKKLKLMK